MANRDLTQEERDALESFIDQANLGAVLEALSDIVGEKSEHIRSNWQDDGLADDWGRACVLITRASLALDSSLRT